MGNVNYSIRLDEEQREKMREIPDMPDRIREFIKREIKRYDGGEQSPAEQFCTQVLDEHGIVGAYCLRQLDFHLVSSKYYLENIETRFEDTEIDTDEARLVAKRIRDDWEESPGISDQVVEDILDVEGYIDEFYDHARQVASSTVEQGGAKSWALWTVVQLFRTVEQRNDGGLSDKSIKKRSITRTLKYHDFDDDEIEDALELLVKVGGLQDWYDSRAYTYKYLNFPDYIVDAIEEGLEEQQQQIRSRVRDYTEEEPYLDMLLELTRGEDHYTYQKELSEETSEKNLQNAIQDGSVVLEYRPSRSSTGRRSSLPSRTYAVLSPDIRDVVSDALFRLKAD